MIDGLFLGYFTSFIPIVCAVTLLVLRAGASRVFFDVVGTFQANRLIKDAKTASVVFQSLMLDAISGVQEAGQAIGDQFAGMMNSMTPIAREIETARIELEKFLNVTEDTAKVQKEIQSIGLDFGFSADQTFQAAARMAQLTGVLGAGSMGVGTEVGMQFGMISNMETEAAMQRMINLQQQTKFMTNGIEENASEQERINGIRENSIRILDQLNTIENRSASTMEQITYVMNQFASQAHITGESIAAMAAQSAVLIEAGEEQGKGGRALRMIYARLGANTNGAADAFHALGIATHDENDNLRSLSKIMMDLNKIYPELEDHEKTTLAQKVAGNRHYTRFLKLSENYNRALELEFEATMRLSPALEEINRRRETDLFQLEQAEARLKNMSGAIGNSLIPALTTATDRQADLNAEIAMFLGDEGIGDVIGRFASFGQILQSGISPMFNTIINLQMLTVAMGTYQSVVRALSGEELINQDAYGNKSDAYQRGTAQMMHYEAGVQDITDALTMQTLELERLTDAEVNNMSKTLEETFALKGQLDGRKQNVLAIQAEIDEYQKLNPTIQNRIDLIQKQDAIEELKRKKLESTKAFDDKIEDVRTNKKLTNKKKVISALEKERNIEQQKLDIQIREQQTMDTADIDTLKLESVLLNMEIKDRERLIATIDEESRAIYNLGITDTNKHTIDQTTIQLLEQMGISYDELTGKLSAHTLQVKIDEETKRKSMLADAAAHAASMNRLSIRMGIMGTMFMMFGSGQKSMRIGMVLNTAAMVMQMRAMHMRTAVQDKETVSSAVNTRATRINTDAIGYDTYITHQNTAASTIAMRANAGLAQSYIFLGGAATAAGHGLKAFGAGVMVAATSVAKAIPFYAALLAASVLLVEGLEALGIMGDADNLNFDSDLESMDKYKASTGELIDMIKDETHTIESLTTSISDKSEEVKKLAKFEDVVSKAKIEQLERELGLEQSLLDIKQAQFVLAEKEAGVFDEEGMEAYFSALEKNTEHVNKYGAEGMGLGNRTLGQSYERTIGDTGRQLKALIPGGKSPEGFFIDERNDTWEATIKAFEEENAVFAEIVRSRSIESLEDWNAFVEGVESGLQILTNSEKQAMGILVDGYQDASDALHDFANSREELFYGFSSDNLTGNLVKQVVQQGVETLITTTEVIMSNTFNGMTTTEVANQILDEIERGAGTRGMSLSSS
jgi:TP901 family phage tail tape measure protein